MGVAPIMEEIKNQWTKNVTSVLVEATLAIPDNKWEQVGGRNGRHSENLGYLLAEMQYMQRTYPNMEW